MLPNLNPDHKKHVLFLSEQSPQVLQDFCKLAIDYLQKGPNSKLYSTAAQKLQVDTKTIQSSVEGLINLLIESRRNHLDNEHFVELIRSLGFSNDQEVVLARLYEVKTPEIDLALTKVNFSLPHYHDLEWRFQVQLASRSLLDQLTPQFTIDLILKNSQTLETEHVLLQSDPNNLLRIAQELESAIGESQTQHMRNIKRNVK